MLSLEVRKFILRKLAEEKISKKELAQRTGISYSVVIQLIKGYKQVPALETIIKLANTFDCFIDEVVDRDISKFRKNKSYNTVLLSEEINNNLKIFLKNKLEEYPIKLTVLAKDIGFNITAISDFIGPKPRKKSIGSAIIIKLADYFDVSVDEMIGRISPSKEEEKILENE